MNPTESFAVLADPTRRAIFESLVRGPSSVARLAEGFSVSRPAVSQHLKTLASSGFVRYTRQGTQNVYEADPAALRGLREYVDYLDALWGEALLNLKAVAESSYTNPTDSSNQTGQP